MGDHRIANIVWELLLACANSYSGSLFLVYNVSISGTPSLSLFSPPISRHHPFHAPFSLSFILSLSLDAQNSCMLFRIHCCCLECGVPRILRRNFVATRINSVPQKQHCLLCFFLLFLLLLLLFDRILHFFVFFTRLSHAERRKQIKAQYTSLFPERGEGREPSWDPEDCVWSRVFGLQ